MPELAAMRAWLLRSWYPGPAHAWLAPLSAVFAAAAASRRFAYRHGLLRSQHPGVPVIVVGNLTAGGTGKTPLVVWLVQQLQAQGMQVGVMLRGYGGRARTPTLVTAGSDPVRVGDEAVLVAQRTACQVAVGAQRTQVARLLVAEGCNILISDDGLQHLALRRDLALVVVDGARGFGNGALLPQGPLREPIASLRKADAVIINGPGRAGLAARIAAPLQMHYEAMELRAVGGERTRPIAALAGSAVHAVAGIGNPERFFALLRDQGCEVTAHAFPDHHPYQPADLAFGDARQIVMTEKDAVKCRAFATDRMWYLPVTAGFAAGDATRLLQLLQRCKTKGGR
jgi:tetraacyldisaccharide 4'-kinase